MPAALRILQEIETQATHDAVLLQAVAECYTHCTKHHDAHRCQIQAAAITPDDPKAIYNLAASAVAVGRIEAAEQLFSRVIALDPSDGDAWYNRSTLRRQTAGSNHVAALEQALASVPERTPREVALCYALSKELEDLGIYDKSFEYLQRGARSRRRQLSYRVEMDLEAMEQIRRAFDTIVAAAPPASPGPGPVFILGLPRSGTTLVDRILSSHSAVASLGEINDLAHAVMSATGAASGKLDLIRRTARADFQALGREYLRRIGGYGASKPFLIDKTPLNFLYLGIIRLALPTAKIVHLRRHPLDSAYAIYKTLFRMGYPFSYDLEDLGRYITAHHRLMNHWRDSLPGGFLDVDYEALVQQPYEVSRSVLDWCGLSWEPPCAAFHLNPTPVATASAAQVREPMHARSLGSWRRHEAQLQPLVRLLQSTGVLAR